MSAILNLVLGCVAAIGTYSVQADPCNPPKHAKVPPVSESTYPKARKRLLLAGWKPFRTKSFSKANEDPDIQSGNGRLFWKRGYVELESCSGTGVAACSFLFKDAYGNHLRVTTAGEELPKEKAYARVTGFEFVCGLEKEKQRK